jgi:hypothetical protein
VGAELFHADGWTEMTKLIVAFRNFAKAPKIEFLLLVRYLRSRHEEQRDKVDNVHKM